MSAFVIFIIIIIAFNVLSSVGEKQLKEKKNNNNPWKSGTDGRPLSRHAQQNLRTRSQAAEKSFGKRRSKQELARQAALRAAAIAARRRKDRNDSRASNRKDIADKNRARVSNWGHRVGPGFLTLTNILVLFAVLIVGLYVWGQVKGNF